MTLQLSQRALTEALTFNGSSTRVYLVDRWALGLLQAVGDAAAGQVVGRQLDPDAIPWQDPDEVHPKLAADVGKDAVAILQLDGEHRIGERLNDRTLYFDRVLLGHGRRCSLSHDECRPKGADTRTRSVSKTARPGKYVRATTESDGREYLRAVVRYGNRVFEVGGHGAVRGDDGPAVGLDLDVGSAQREHRLDGEADARRE